MSNYKDFKIEACFDKTKFRVFVKGWFGIWKSGFVHTDYFSCYYDSHQEALDAIQGYKNRFTLVDGES